MKKKASKVLRQNGYGSWTCYGEFCHRLRLEAKTSFFLLGTHKPCSRLQLDVTGEVKQQMTEAGTRQTAPSGPRNRSVSSLGGANPLVQRGKGRPLVPPDERGEWIQCTRQVLYTPQQAAPLAHNASQAAKDRCRRHTRGTNKRTTPSTTLSFVPRAKVPMVSWNEAQGTALSSRYPGRARSTKRARALARKVSTIARRKPPRESRKLPRGNKSNMGQRFRTAYPYNESIFMYAAQQIRGTLRN